jgi:hypothetical protein
MIILHEGTERKSEKFSVELEKAEKSYNALATYVLNLPRKKVFTGEQLGDNFFAMIDSLISLLNTIEKTRIPSSDKQAEAVLKTIRQILRKSEKEMQTMALKLGLYYF